MSGWERPWVLWLLVPWLLVAGRWAGVQLAAWREARERTRPRGRPAVTRAGPVGFRLHLAALLAAGGLLVVAAAGPVERGEGTAEGRQDPVLLVLDASVSMYASDLGEGWTGADVTQRFRAAVDVATRLVETWEGRPVGLASYSGVATLHLPPVADSELVREALRVAEPHNYYRRTGSSLGAALRLAAELAAEDPDLQVVLLGDGELPRPESWEEPLAALEDLGVPVHAATFGSLEGQARLILDLADVVAEREERKKLLEYTTRRVDEHYRSIAGRTGGRFLVAEAGPEAAAALGDAVGSADGRVRPLAGGGAVADRAPLLMALVLLFVLVDRWSALRPPPPLPFRLDALGTPPERTGRVRASAEPTSGGGGTGRHGSRSASGGPERSPVGSAAVALLILLVSCSGGDDLERAHAANEQGIRRDAIGLHEAAAAHYRRSAGFGIRPWIPTANLARSAHLDERFGEAHDLYQEALRLDPGLAEAVFGHGVLLWDWGESLRDPRGCRLERTRDLWQQAARRFELLGGEETGAALREEAARNERHVGRRLAEVEAAIAEPPPECLAPPPPSAGESDQGASGGGGSSDGGGGGGGGEPDAEDGGGGSSGGDDGEGAPPPGGPGAAGAPPPEADGDDGSEPPPEGDGSEPPPDGGDSGSGADGGDGSPPPEAPPRGPEGGRSGAGSGSGSGGGGAGLTPEEQQQVEEALAGIRERRHGDGRFFRRTLAEQFPKEEWSNPDPELWW